MEMTQAKPREFLKEIENALRELMRENISSHLLIVRRLNNPEMMGYARPTLWKENVHGLGFGKIMTGGSDWASFDPAFNLEIWTCRNKAGFLYHGEHQKVETTRQVWSRIIHVAYSVKGPGACFGSSPAFDLRHDRERARTEILQHAAWIADFWQNNGAVALLHMPSLRLYVGKKERARQRYILARVQDPRGNHANTVWCAPVADAKDEDALASQVLESLRSRFRKEDDVEFTATCLGGGFLEIDYDKQKIVIGGQSEEYGKEPDRKDTYFLIKKVWYPDWDVEVRD